MSGVKYKKTDGLSSTATVLLSELREECEHVAALISRLETQPPSGSEQDKILGELSAAVLHLHTHTDGLDDFLCETE